MLRKDEQKALKCSLENLTTTGKGELPQQQGVRPWQGTELHRKQRTERASSKLPFPPPPMVGSQKQKLASMFHAVTLALLQDGTSQINGICCKM